MSDVAGQPSAGGSALKTYPLQDMSWIDMFSMLAAAAGAGHCPMRA